SYLEQLRFHLVGYGCTTCIGNSGPLPEPVSAAVAAGELVVCAVLSGNRNFEGRIQQEVRANYLASPPLVVAYALAGRIDHYRLSGASACWACWGTASARTASRPPARSARRVRPESIWWSMPSYPKTSTRTARAVAITRRSGAPASPTCASRACAPRAPTRR